MACPRTALRDVLDPLLAAPACAAIGPAMRAALHEAIAATDAGPDDAALRDTPAVLADTLSALAMLESDGDVLAAAILHACPALRARMQP